MGTFPIIQKIKTDNKSGASELKQLAIKSIYTLLDETKPTELKAILTNFLKELASARPSMAPIQRLARNIQESLKEGSKNIKMEIEKVLEKEKKLDLQAIIQNASHVLGNKKIILTYSYSNTVLQVIKNFPHLKVIVSESRPVYEGRILARALLEAKLKVTFITDAEISKFIEQSDVILVGADRIMEDSLVNKVGTKAIAIMAKEFGIPIYGICGTDKFLSAQISPFKEEMKSPNEVWKMKKINGLKVLNFYFEKVPLPYFTGIITEQGIVPAKDIPKYL